MHGQTKLTVGKAYLPLEFEAGKDAQVDWGEAVVIMAGIEVKVQFFVLRLNYSRVRFVKAYPFQKQGAFLDGHESGFHFIGGVPQRITYDNPKTAVFRILEGHNRQEQEAFKAFRSYYLFDSHYCTPAQGHEKGGVESDVGYAQRNFFSPLPRVNDYDELNQLLLERCKQDVNRHTRLLQPADLFGDLVPLPPEIVDFLLRLAPLFVERKELAEVQFGPTPADPLLHLIQMLPNEP